MYELIEKAMDRLLHLLHTIIKVIGSNILFKILPEFPIMQA
ncbi:MAG: hypothetical protein ACE5HR_00695 [bacterium]